MPNRRVLLAAILSFAAHFIAGVCLIAVTRPSAAVPFKTAVLMEISLIAGAEGESKNLSPALSRKPRSAAPEKSDPPDRFGRTEGKAGFRAAGSAGVVLASLGSVRDLKSDSSGEAAVTAGPFSGNGAGKPSSGLEETAHAGLPGKAGPGSSETTVLPRYREHALPPYPWLARLKGQEGLAVLSAEILPDGTVGTVRIKTSSGHVLLDQSALESIRGWRFEPGLRRGTPATMWVEVPVRFALKTE